MPRTTGSDGPETRERIVESSVGLFRTHGFAGTSIREIAAASKVTASTLYYHFESKDRILEAIVTPFLKQLAAFVDRETNELTSLESLLDEIAQVWIDNSTVIGAVLSDPSAMTHIVTGLQLPTVMFQLERTLARSDNPSDILRARCSLNALQGGFVSISPIGDGGVYGFSPAAVPSDEARRVIVAAALAALKSEG